MIAKKFSMLKKLVLIFVLIGIIIVALIIKNDVRFSKDIPKYKTLNISEKIEEQKNESEQTFEIEMPLPNQTLESFPQNINND